MARSTLASARTLYSLAHGQCGYFTAKQARGAGYDYPHLDYHVSTGAFERMDHGLYRLTRIPPAEHDELVRWTFWSRDRRDEPQAVASHETALVLHGLSELLPNALHFTVPPTFRKVAPRGCVLHKRRLGPADAEERGGFRVTTPLRTLTDTAQSGVSREQFEKAVVEAIAGGLIRRAEGDAVLERKPGRRTGVNAS